MNPEYRAMNAAIHLSVGAVWVLTQDVDVNPEIHQRGDGFLDHHLFRPRCSAFFQKYAKTSVLLCFHPKHVKTTEKPRNNPKPSPQKNL